MHPRGSVSIRNEMEGAGKVKGKGGRWKAEVFDALKKPAEPVTRWWDSKEMCWKEKQK